MNLHRLSSRNQWMARGRSAGLARGELRSEVACHADCADRVAGRLLDVGATSGIVSFGIEELDVLRVEKGFLHVGNETDGTTMPQDVGFAVPLLRKRADFIGRRGASMPVGQAPGRKQLVGLESPDGRKLPVGAHVRIPGGTGSDGWVTSSVLSPTIGRPHALTMIADGRSRVGEEIVLWDLGTDNGGCEYPARIIEPCGFDPERARMRDAA